MFNLRILFGKIHSLILLSFFTVHLVNAQTPSLDWHHMSMAEGYPGVSSKKAFETLLADRPSQTVIVAVIDSGIDIEHEDLKDNIWINTKEIPGNGIDDDQNGYIDDVYGWNFIGGPFGDVGPETYESTRIYAALRYKYENAFPDKLTSKQKKEYEIFVKARDNVMEERKKAENSLKQIEAIENNIISGLKEIKSLLDARGLNLKQLDSLNLRSEARYNVTLNVLKQFLADEPQIDDIGELINTIENAIGKDKEQFKVKLDFHFNPDFDSRKTIVMDNYSDSRERIYGNNNVVGPDATHGTHVAGIIGALYNNGKGMDGIARNVKIMAIRAVPDGDERDKDVANAIRYAVDNGASIINMSFGKGFDWDKQVVDEAVKYAEKKDVLLVHAAGNGSLDLSQNENFPNRYFLKKGSFLCRKPEAKNWIEVGANSFRSGEDLPAVFSNYGKKEVDIFAPGVSIYSTMPESKYAALQGTSMASPVVAGIAAVLRSYFPELTAEQVKEIILNSATKFDQEVKVPGRREVKKMPFSSLSVTGGVANLEEAVKLAATVKGKKKIKAVMP